MHNFMLVAAALMQSTFMWFLLSTALFALLFVHAKER